MEKKKLIKKEVKEEEVVGIIVDKEEVTYVTEPEPIPAPDPRLELTKDIARFINSMIGKTRMTKQEAETFCMLWARWNYRDPKTSGNECRPNCESCIIKFYPQMKEVGLQNKHLI